MKTYFLMILFLVSSTNTLWCQQTIIKGKVVEAMSNKPIENASIQIKKSNEIVNSDSDGNFTINAAIGDVLIIRHLSFESKEIRIETSKLSIALDVKHINLENIIVEADVLKDLSQSKVVVDHVKSTTQPRNVSDLFRDIPGFGIQKRGAYASEPFFRAFKYEQLNIQLDGGMKILNACPNRMDPITTHIISDEIERIEVVKGPYTMRFGPNFGGIVNLVSRNPNTLANGIHGDVEAGYETNGDNLSTRGSISYKTDQFDISLNGEYRDYGDYEDGEGTVVPSSFKSTDYSVKLGYNPTEKQRIQLSWRQSFGSDIKHAGLPMDSPYDDSFLAGLDYKVTDISDLISSFSFKGFYSEVDHLMTNENRPSYKVTEAASNVFSTTYGGKTELVLTPNDNLFIYTGLDANLIGREGDRERTVKIMNGNTLATPKLFTDKIWQDSKLNDFGVFVEGKYRLTNLFTLTAGLRSDFVNASINDAELDFLQLYGGEIDDTNETNISGTVSLKYKSEDTQVQIALGRGVRTASMIERFVNHFSVGVDPYEYVGNPNLDPEINNQIEVSFNKRFDQIEVGASVFYSLIIDYIVPVVDENISRKFMPSAQPTFAKRFINIDEASQSGFEFYFNYEINKDFKFTTDISYTYAQNEEYDEPLPQITPLTAHAGLQYEKEQFWTRLNSRFVAAQNRTSKSFMETASNDFATFDFSIGFVPIKNLTVGASVLNIFDTTYYEHLNFSYQNSDLLSGRIFEPGRNFTVKVNYKF
ncbi:TonB-dependent receptor [Aureibaculum algae]|uniref:TonB-dependent receptor n=1 Tax=Aureibaculum algae TaxID=2584122 RepID=A0A5B7TXB6_9FLAO|nr:TonB-dependent receptor [Aureibaculum algae]QCX39487.1 TonB-dependent receptor [Aureibaculum algae]